LSEKIAKIKVPLSLHPDVHKQVEDLSKGATARFLEFLKWQQDLGKYVDVLQNGLSWFAAFNNAESFDEDLFLEYTTRA